MTKTIVFVVVFSAVAGFLVRDRIQEWTDYNKQSALSLAIRNCPAYTVLLSPDKTRCVDMMPRAELIPPAPVKSIAKMNKRKQQFVQHARECHEVEHRKMNGVYLVLLSCRSAKTTVKAVRTTWAQR